MFARPLAPLIVHVDESAGHALILEETFQSFLRGYRYRYFSDAENAVSFLESSRLPVALVIITRQLPRCGCMYALTWIQHDTRLSGVPIVVLDDQVRPDAGLPPWVMVDFILPRPPSPEELRPVFLRLAAPSVLT